MDLHQISLVCNDWGGAQLVIGPGGTVVSPTWFWSRARPSTNARPGWLQCRTAALPGGTFLTEHLHTFLAAHT